MALSLGTNGSREHASTPPLRGYAQHERQKSRLLPCHPFALSVAERSRRARIPRTIANLMPLPARGEGTQEWPLRTNANRCKREGGPAPRRGAGESRVRRRVLRGWHPPVNL